MSDFNLSAELRTALQANPSLKNREIIEIVQQKFPKQTINSKTAMVSVSVSRRKLGLSKSSSKVVKQKRAAVKQATTVATKAPAGSAGMSGLATLSAAKTLLEECQGDEAMAVQAIRELASLQLN